MEYTNYSNPECAILFNVTNERGLRFVILDTVFHVRLSPRGGRKSVAELIAGE